jgi:hypothetical protein
VRLSWDAAEVLEEFSTPSHQGGGYERATELTLPTFPARLQGAVPLHEAATIVSVMHIHQLYSRQSPPRK